MAGRSLYTVVIDLSNKYQALQRQQMRIIVLEIHSSLL